ncbi:MAG TPA: chloride channel protein [Negativicutes bacterium]
MRIPQKLCVVHINILEQLVLVSSLVKWTFYGATTGVIVGLGTAAFLTLLEWAITVWTVIPYYYLWIPAVLFLNSLMVWLLAPEVEAGSDKAIEAIHKRRGYLPLMEAPIKLVATVITIAAGGSAGKEGPAAQIGATLASTWSRFIKANDIDCQKMAICGLSAGFAAVFGTPVAGAIFGVEVLFIGKIMYDVLYPALIAGLTSYYVANSLGVAYLYQNVYVQPSIGLMGNAILLGLVSGLLAILFIQVVKTVNDYFKLLTLWKPLKALVGGVLLALLGFCGGVPYLGLGMGLLWNGIQGQFLAQSALIWKTLATAITLGCGGTGGIITPIMVVGASIGNLFGQIAGGVDIPGYTAIGMAALLAGAVNTPIAAVLMTVELFGVGIIPYAAIGCLASYLISGHRSVYLSQIVAMGKSSSLQIAVGQPVGCLSDPKLNLRPQTLCSYILKSYLKSTAPGEADKGGIDRRSH